MSRNKFIFAAITAILFCQIALARSPSPAGAVEYIISPAPNADVTSPVTIKFGLKGMGVAPAGVDKPNTGHHHLLIDVTEIPLLDKPIPKDDHHLHFGGGQTETTLELSPGQHTLQLIFGDKDHMPFDPPVMSDKITITVK
jgi:Domain of unknown function (DUF4399)